MSAPTFTTAPLVAADDAPTSARWNVLAAAFNDRLKSGLGDPTWRIHWKAFSLFRRFGNPDTGDANLDSWFRRFCHLLATNDAPAEALDTTSPIPQFVLGDEDSSIDPEAAWIGAIPGGSPTTDAEKWTLARQQRGAIDPDHGWISAAPVWDASGHLRGFYMDHNADDVVTDRTKTTFGGILGTPSVTSATFKGLRGLADYSPANVANIHRQQDRYVIAWGPAESIVEGVTYTVEGSTGTVTYATEEYAIGQTFIGVAGDTTYTQEDDAYPYAPNETLWRRDYILQPGFTTSISHVAQDVGEWVNAFAASFRGSASQRASDGYRVKSIAFDFEAFCSKQFSLAPAWGTKSGDTVDDAVGYPIFYSAYDGDDIPALGVYLDEAHSSKQGTDYEFPEGFVVIGMKVVTGALMPGFDATGFKLKKGADDYTGHAYTQGGSETKYYSFDASLDRFDGDWLNVEWTDIGTESLEITFAIVKRHTPDPVDCYVVLRRQTAVTTPGAVDTYGDIYTRASSLAATLLRNGCISTAETVQEQSGSNVHQNPVYQTLGTQIRNNLRWLDASHFQSYAEADGKAVLRFDRKTTVAGHVVDMWDGIAPPIDPIASGKLIVGWTYIVQGTTGSVTHNGVEYAIDDEFTAAKTSFTATGDCAVYQVNGVCSAAPKHGWSNTWQLFMTFTPDETDINGALVDRCHLDSAELRTDGTADAAALCELADSYEGMDPSSIHPRLPTGLRYPFDINLPANMTTSDAENFCSSCRVYEPDYEIESVKSEDDGATVVVTLTTTLRTGTGYRADGNALEDYIAFRDSATPASTMPGDFSINGVVAPEACIVPRFYLTKRIPLAYEDTPPNTTQDANDTAVDSEPFRWMWWILDAMAPAYIDEDALGTVCGPEFPCYTVETLCWRALGRPWWMLLNDRNAAHNPPSFGILPNTRLYAAGWNDVAQCINKLVHLPVWLPRTFQSRQLSTAGGASVTISVQDDSPNYPLVVNRRADMGEADFAWDGIYSSGWTAWADGAGGLSPSKSANGSFAFVDGTSSHDVYTGLAMERWSILGVCNQQAYPVSSPQVVGSRNKFEIRCKPNSAAVNAMPSAVKDLLDASGRVYIASADTLSYWTEDAAGTVVPNCESGISCAWLVGSFVGLKLLSHSEATGSCQENTITSAFFSGSESLTYDAPDVPDSTLFQMLSGHAACCCCDRGPSTMRELQSISTAVVTVGLG